jgi:hypothetical protein
MSWHHHSTTIIFFAIHLLFFLGGGRIAAFDSATNCAITAHMVPLLGRGWPRGSKIYIYFNFKIIVGIFFEIFSPTPIWHVSDASILAGNGSRQAADHVVESVHTVDSRETPISTVV